MSKPFLSLQNLTKRFQAPKGGEALTVFENVNLGIEKGSLFASSAIPAVANRQS